MILCLFDELFQAFFGVGRGSDVQYIILLIDSHDVLLVMYSHRLQGVFILLVVALNSSKKYINLEKVDIRNFSRDLCQQLFSFLVAVSVEIDDAELFCY